MKKANRKKAAMKVRERPARWRKCGSSQTAGGVCAAAAGYLRPLFFAPVTGLILVRLDPDMSLVNAERYFLFDQAWPFLVSNRLS